MGFNDVLDALIEFRGDSLTDADRDEILDTIASTYETFEDQAIR